MGLEHDRVSAKCVSDTAPNWARPQQHVITKLHLPLISIVGLHVHYLLLDSTKTTDRRFTVANARIDGQGTLENGQWPAEASENER